MVLKKLQGTSFKVMQLTKLMTFMIIANESSEREGASLHNSAQGPKQVRIGTEESTNS